MSGVRLTGRISVVGGGATGLGISHALDPNVYLLSGGEELALVDAGAGPGEDRILENVRSLGYEPGQIGHIFLTHAHADHAGGAASLAERLGARVYLSELEREALENADEEALGLPIARRNGYYPENYRLRACKVDVSLQEDERLRCGDLELVVIPTPGHSTGSVCFLVDTDEGAALFAGDTVFAGGRISLLVAPGSDLLAMQASVAGLGGLNVTSLLPGHGIFPLEGGQEHIDQAIDAFATMLPPRSILQ
ncbi:MAG: MBL fold metallo-hydrolase [Actinobacteria bacterium]|nr:MBL fold metallo-hydrolase [Actinomycetota bacterium]